MSKQFGAALKEAREHRRLEQHELAALLGVSESTISKIEHGRRELKAPEMLTLGLLFPQWFEVQVEDLVTDLKADLAARLRQFLAGRSFAPVEYTKRDWLHQRLFDLDGEPTISA